MRPTLPSPDPPCAAGARGQGGIVYSNAVTTVSPTYAREALEGGAAGWLRATLARSDVRAKFQARAALRAARAPGIAIGGRKARLPLPALLRIALLLDWRSGMAGPWRRVPVRAQR